MVTPSDNRLYQLFLHYHLLEGTLLLALIGAAHLVKATFGFLQTIRKSAFRLCSDVTKDWFELYADAGVAYYQCKSRVAEAKRLYLRVNG